MLLYLRKFRSNILAMLGAPKKTGLSEYSDNPDYIIYIYSDGVMINLPSHPLQYRAHCGVHQLSCYTHRVNKQ